MKEGKKEGSNRERKEGRKQMKEIRRAGGNKEGSQGRKEGSQ